MLGSDLVEASVGRDVTAARPRRPRRDRPRRRLRGRPRATTSSINAAAYTAVDAAETDEEAALAVNGTAVGLLAEAAAAVGAKFVTVSTDYVFDGRRHRALRRGQPRDPLNAYGRTKAEGERLALAAHPDGTYVVRTAWLYGRHGANFAEDHARLAGDPRHRLSVVDDQVGPAHLDRSTSPARSSPSSTPDAPAGRLPRHELGRDELVRVRPRGVHGGRTRPC